MRRPTAVSAWLDEETRVRCFPYAGEAPILDVSTGSLILSLTVPDRAKVTDCDVRIARELLDAVGRFTLAVESAHEQHRVVDPAAGVA